eukprot:gene1362-22537_t
MIAAPLNSVPAAGAAAAPPPIPPPVPPPALPADPAPSADSPRTPSRKHPVAGAAAVEAGAGEMRSTGAVAQQPGPGLVTPPYCDNVLNNPMQLGCGHIVCYADVQNAKCPICNEPANKTVPDANDRLRVGDANYHAANWLRQQEAVMAAAGALAAAPDDGGRRGVQSVLEEACASNPGDGKHVWSCKEMLPGSCTCSSCDREPDGGPKPYWRCGPECGATLCGRCYDEMLAAGAERERAAGEARRPAAGAPSAAARSRRVAWPS